MHVYAEQDRLTRDTNATTQQVQSNSNKREQFYGKLNI